MELSRKRFKKKKKTGAVTEFNKVKLFCILCLVFMLLSLGINTLRNVPTYNLHSNNQSPITITKVR